MTLSPLDSIQTLVSDRLGLHIRDIDKPDFHKKLRQRMVANGLQELGEYCELLTSFTSETEWLELIPLLTTGETYFFRDKGQIELLKDSILPAIIDRARKEQTTRRLPRPTLKIWSAGCSGGEEAYTLAILLSQLINNIQQWNITILGTDLNPEAIAKADKGLYREWSFRQVDKRLVNQYFVPVGDEWQVKPHLRQMTRFRTGNLLAENTASPFADTREMDLAICRNVFIYFQADTIAKIVGNIHNALKVGGYFISGHSELHEQDMSHFDTLNYAQSTAYQKRASNQKVRPSFTAQAAPSHSISSQPAQRNQPSPVPSATANVSNTAISSALNSAQIVMQEMAKQAAQHTTSPHTTSPKRKPTISSAAAIQQAQLSGMMEVAAGSNTDSVEDLLRQATSNLECDRLDMALKLARQASDLAPTACNVLYLMARIYEAQDNTKTAKTVLRQILFLESDSPSAYVKLAEIYRQEGNQHRAKKMSATAIELLTKLPSSMPIEHEGKTVLAEDLIRKVNESA